MDVQNQIDKAKELDTSGREAAGAGNFEKAAGFFDKAAKIYESIDDNINRGLQLFNTGSCYQALEKNNQSLDAYKKSYDLIKNNENLQKYQAMILNNLGLLYVSFKDYDQALSSFEAACKIYETIKDEDGKALQLQNIGSVHRDMKQSESAIELYSRSLEIFEKIGNKYGEADQCTNIAYIYSVDNKVGEALKWYKKALGIYRDIHEDTKADLTDKNIKQLEKMQS